MVVVVVVVVVAIFDKRTRFLLTLDSGAQSSGSGVHETRTVMVLNGLSLQKRCSYFVAKTYKVLIECSRVKIFLIECIFFFSAVTTDMIRYERHLSFCAIYLYFFFSNMSHSISIFKPACNRIALFYFLFSDIRCQKNRRFHGVRKCGVPV